MVIRRFFMHVCKTLLLPLLMGVSTAVSAQSLKLDSYGGRGVVLGNGVKMYIADSTVVGIGGGLHGNFFIEDRSTVFNQGEIQVEGDVVITEEGHNPFQNFGNYATQHADIPGIISFFDSSSTSTLEWHKFIWNKLDTMQLSGIKVNSARGLLILDSLKGMIEMSKTSMRLTDSLILEKGILHSPMNIILSSENPRFDEGLAITDADRYKYVIGDNISPGKTGSFSRENMIVLMQDNIYVVKIINPFAASESISDTDREDLLTFNIPLGNIVGGDALFAPMRLEYKPLRFANSGAEREINTRAGYRVSPTDVISSARDENPSYEIASALPSSYGLADSIPHIAFRTDHEKTKFERVNAKYNSFTNYLNRNYTVRDHLLSGDFDFELILGFDAKDTVGTIPDVPIPERDKIFEYLAPFVWNDADYSTNTEEIFNLVDDLNAANFDPLQERFNAKGEFGTSPPNAVNADGAITIDFLRNSEFMLRDSIVGLVGKTSGALAANNLGVISIFENIFFPLDIEVDVLLTGYLDSVNIFSRPSPIMRNNYQKDGLLPIHVDSIPYISTSKTFPAYFGTGNDTTFSFASVDNFNEETLRSIDTIVYRNTLADISDYIYVELIDSATNKKVCGAVGLLTTSGRIIDTKFDIDVSGTKRVRNIRITCSPAHSYYVRVDHMNHFPVRSQRSRKFSSTTKTLSWNFIDDSTIYHKPLTTNTIGGATLINPYFIKNEIYKKALLVPGRLTHDRILSNDLPTDEKDNSYDISDLSSFVRNHIESSKDYSTTGNPLTGDDLLNFTVSDYYGAFDITNDGVLRYDPMEENSDYSYIRRVLMGSPDRVLKYEINTEY